MFKIILLHFYGKIILLSLFRGRGVRRIEVLNCKTYDIVIVFIEFRYSVGASIVKCKCLKSFPSFVDEKLLYCHCSQVGGGYIEYRH